MDLFMKTLILKYFCNALATQSTIYKKLSYLFNHELQEQDILP